MAVGIEAPTTEPWLLDPNRYADDLEHGYPIARLLAPEIEKERARLMRSEKVIVYESLLGGSISRKPSQQVPWYELLAQLDLLTRICDRKVISVANTCYAIWKFLTPPNWQVFFWMDKWMEESGKSAITEWKFKKLLADTGREQREQQRVQLSRAGKQGAANKHRKYAELKAWALGEAKRIKGDDMTVARKLSALIPQNLASVSKDPQRLIYDALRSNRRTDRA